jgi:hypothetical protein
MIMENSLPQIDNTEMHYCFDMKGSSINREVLKDLNLEELSKNPPTKGKVLKDLDYVRLNECKHFWNMRNSDSVRTLKQI